MHINSPVDTGNAEVDGGVERTLGALPVDTLLHLNTTATTLQGEREREEREMNEISLLR
jgi:hypothetical protein